MPDKVSSPSPRNPDPSQPTHERRTTPSSTRTQAVLSQRLKRLGFSNASRMKLYGEEFDLVSDPIVETETVVFIDAVERRSHQPRRVRIPLNIVNMANAA